MSNKTIDAEAFVAYVQELGKYTRKTDATNAIKSVVFGLQKALFENDVVAVNHLGVFTKKQQEPKEVVDKYTLLKTMKLGGLGVSFLMNKEIEEVINMPKFPLRAYNSAPKRAPRTPKAPSTENDRQTELNFTSAKADEEPIITPPTEEKSEKVEQVTASEPVKDTTKVEKSEKAKTAAEKKAAKVKACVAEAKRKALLKKNAMWQRAYRRRLKAEENKAKPKRKPSLRRAILGDVYDTKKD